MIYQMKRKENKQQPLAINYVCRLQLYVVKRERRGVGGARRLSPAPHNFCACLVDNRSRCTGHVSHLYMNFLASYCCDVGRFHISSRRRLWCGGGWATKSTIK